MRSLVAIAILLLIWQVGNTKTSCTGDSIVITQAQVNTPGGYTLSVDDTCYCFESAKLTSDSGYALKIAANDIILVLNRNSARDTLAFGTEGRGNDTGIYILVNPDADTSITIQGGAIVHQSSDTTTSDNYCFVGYGLHRFHLDDVHMVVMGYDGIIWKTGSSAWQNRFVHIDGGEWWNNVTSYTSRCQYDAICMEYNEGGIDTTVDSGLIIDGLKIRQAPGPALQVAGDVEIKNCSLWVDARCDWYTYPASGCQGTTNSAGIIAQLLDAGSSIHDNVIMAGEDFFGCDVGILVQVSQGELGNEVIIEDNWMYLHADFDAYYEHITPKGVKNRYGCDHLIVRNNYIEIEVGTFDAADSARGTTAVGLEVTSYAGSSDWPSAGGNEPDSNVHYLHNTVLIIPVDSNRHGTTLGYTCFRMATSDSAGHTWAAAGNIFQYNVCTTPEFAYRWGPYDHGGEVHDFVTLGDSIYYSDSLWLNSVNMAHYVGYNDVCPDNIARDVYYGGRAADSATANKIIDFCDGCGDAGDRDISFERTLAIFIEGSNGLPVSGATFKAIDNYGNVQINTTSGADGMIELPVRYWKEYEIAADSTAYNPFVIGAKMGADSTGQAFTVSHDTWVDTIILAATEGAQDVEPVAIKGSVTLKGSVTIK
jgi:hypothetical protein